jgi:autotransporter-associated beta strand protein
MAQPPSPTAGTITGLTAPGLVLQGNFNNTLVNTGTIKGNGPLINGVPTAVQFGSGIATLIMQAGLINGALIKNGTGTWMLDESFTYFGATTINAGTLQLGRSASCSIEPDSRKSLSRGV